MGYHYIQQIFLCQVVVLAEDDLEDRLKKSVRALGELEARSDLEIAIVDALLDGPRTVAELSRIILGPEPRGHQANYMKVKRSVETLESKGYLSSSILGKPKPYRLTPYAREKLGSLASGELPKSRLLTVWDLVLYTITIFLASMTAFGQYDWYWIPMFFVYLAGISTVRLFQTLRRIS